MACLGYSGDYGYLFQQGTAGTSEITVSRIRSSTTSAVPESESASLPQIKPEPLPVKLTAASGSTWKSFTFGSTCSFYPPYVYIAGVASSMFYFVFVSAIHHHLHKYHMITAHK